MKKSKYHLFVISLFTSILLFACQSEVPTSANDSILLAKYGGGNGGGLAFEFSQEEKDGLIHMRIEEKLARDVYIIMCDLWNHKVFLNIQLSEQKHMDAVKRLLDKYNVPDPLTTDSVGVFPDPQFQQLYNQLIEQGNQSLQEALLVGKTIEELDIADLEFQLSFVDNPDIIKVYQNLKAASENHLAAFNRCLNIPTSE
ncbi:MAG: DUF2202 domain-containing protein [Ignavibacteriaceae bacterium]|jgi:hypothetical protein|nr:DUF2202 domain-containing protein [Ignavibacteriaceae bacterium]